MSNSYRSSYSTERYIETSRRPSAPVQSQFTQSAAHCVPQIAWQSEDARRPTYRHVGLHIWKGTLKHHVGHLHQSSFNSQLIAHCVPQIAWQSEDARKPSGDFFIFMPQTTCWHHQPLQPRQHYSSGPPVAMSGKKVTHIRQLEGGICHWWPLMDHRWSTIRLVGHPSGGPPLATGGHRWPTITLLSAWSVSAGIDFRHLTTKVYPHTVRVKIFLTKTFMMISKWKRTFDLHVWCKICQRRKS